MIACCASSATAVEQTGLDREWLESEFARLPEVNGKKAVAWVQFVGSCAKEAAW